MLFVSLSATGYKSLATGSDHSVLAPDSYL